MTVNVVVFSLIPTQGNKIYLMFSFTHSDNKAKIAVLSSASLNATCSVLNILKQNVLTLGSLFLPCYMWDTA